MQTTNLNKFIVEFNDTKLLDNYDVCDIQVINKYLGLYSETFLVRYYQPVLCGNKLLFNGKRDGKPHIITIDIDAIKSYSIIHYPGKAV